MTAPAIAPLAVKCADLTKEFGSGDTRTLALRGVEMTVPSGKLTMLVGPSGCGKTTLISVIAGLLDRTSGDLKVLGTDAAKLTRAGAVEFRRRNLGFIFQSYNLLPSLTAAENAAVPLFAAGMDLKSAVKKSKALLARLELSHRAEAYPRQLSGGQQQRVAIARALVHEPRLVLCDEPTAALDAHTGHEVMAMLAEASVQPDRAVIVVTHDNRIYDFAHRIVHMDDGQVTAVEEK